MSENYHAMNRQYDLLIDRKTLIRLVKERPVVWDKYSPTYRNKRLTTEAWREVASLLVTNYEELEDKYFFEKCVIKRWTRIRDGWKKILGLNKAWRDTRGASGSGTLYKYHPILTFLKPVIDPENLHNIDNTSIASSRAGTEEPEDDIPLVNVKSEDIGEAAVEKRVVKPTQPPVKKRKYTVTQQDHLSSKEKDERNLLFLKSILPSLRLLDDDGTLEFQSGVINLVQTLKREGISRLQSSTSRFQACYASPRSPSEASMSLDPMRSPSPESD